MTNHQKTIEEMLNIYMPCYDYDLISDYVFPENIEDWNLCPRCNSKPKQWVFDNGSHASCKCGNSKYDHLTVSVESIGSHVRKNNGSMEFYDSDALRKAWNAYCDEAATIIKRNEGGEKWNG